MPTIYSVRIHHKFNRFRFYLNFKCFAIISCPLSLTVLFLGNAAQSFVCRPEKSLGFVKITALFSCDTEYHYRHYYCMISIRGKSSWNVNKNLRFGGDSAGPISLFLSLHLTDRLIVT